MAAEPSRRKGVPTSFAPEKGGLGVVDGRAVRVLLIEPMQAYVTFMGVGEKAWVPVASLRPFLEVECQSEIAPVTPSEQSADLDVAALWYQEIEKEPLEPRSLPRRKREIAEAMGVSVRTVERRLAKYVDDPSPKGLLPYKPGPETGSSRQSSAVQALMDRTIKRDYLSSQRKSVRGAYRALQIVCDEAKEPLPSYNTFRRRILARDNTETIRRRHGRVLSKARVEPAGPKTRADSPLDVVQIDHAIADIFVVDSVDRKPIGRPWLSLAIDVATRTVPGFYYSLRAPDHANVGITLERCCLPKDDWLAAIGYEGDWLPYGLMKTVGWDNAKYFRAVGLVNACQRMGIQPKFRQVRTPTHGAHIERLIGTMMGQLHLLPGTAFSNPHQREEYDPEKHACMTLGELTLWTAIQINDVYHNAPHAGLAEEHGFEISPLGAWKHGMTGPTGYRAPKVPVDRRQFLNELLPGKWRVVGREGIKRFANKYWDSSLVPHIGERLWVAHDPRDISELYVRADSQWLVVPWRDRTLPPCSLEEYDHHRARARRLGESPDGERVLRGLRKQREIEENSKKATKAVRRRREERPADRSDTADAEFAMFDRAPRLVEDPF